MEVNIWLTIDTAASGSSIAPAPSRKTYLIRHARSLPNLSSRRSLTCRDRVDLQERQCRGHPLALGNETLCRMKVLTHPHIRIRILNRSRFRGANDGLSCCGVRSRSEFADLLITFSLTSLICRKVVIRIVARGNIAADAGRSSVVVHASLSYAWSRTLWNSLLKAMLASHRSDPQSVPVRLAWLPRLLSNSDSAYLRMLAALCGASGRPVG